MGTVGVTDRYPLPRVEQIVEARYLYCHPGPEGKLIQQKYFGRVRDDVTLADCCVSQLKVKAGESEPTESWSQIDFLSSEHRPGGIPSGMPPGFCMTQWDSHSCGTPE